MTICTKQGGFKIQGSVSMNMSFTDGYIELVIKNNSKIYNLDNNLAEMNINELPYSRSLKYEKTSMVIDLNEIEYFDMMEIS